MKTYNNMTISKGQTMAIGDMSWLPQRWEKSSATCRGYLRGGMVIGDMSWLPHRWHGHRRHVVATSQVGKSSATCRGHK
jgi:hypothetical protein